MSEKEQFSNQPSTPETKWPSQEELAEIIGKISIPDEWKVVEPSRGSWDKEKRPVTAEYLQELGRRLVDEQPMSCGEWHTITEELYKKVNYSKQPEAQRLWELCLERGIRDLSHLIENTTIEEIRARGDEMYKDKYEDPDDRAVMYLTSLNEIVDWYHGITRLLQDDAGTTNEAIIRLSEQMLEKVTIPFVKKEREITPNAKQLATESFIKEIIQRLEIAKLKLEFESSPVSDAEYESRVKTHTSEILERI